MRHVLAANPLQFLKLWMVLFDWVTLEPQASGVGDLNSALSVGCEEFAHVPHVYAGFL